MPVTANPEVTDLALPEHGAIGEEILRELRLSPAQVADFSVNTNPLGPPHRVDAALQHLDVARYPDPEGGILREALSRRLDIKVDHILLGNGSIELIWLATLAYLRPGNSVMLLTPTFGEYERAARIAGATLYEERATVDASFRWDLEAVQQGLRDHPPRICFLCNPNNPTGVYLRASEVEPLLRAAPDTLFVIDESYLMFVDEPNSLLRYVEEGNLLLLRSMTKDYALAGLRLGYGVASIPIIDALRRVQPPWSVNTPAQVAGLAALSDLEYLQWSRDAVRESRALLAEGLTALGVKVFPSAANFILVEVGDAQAMREALLKKGFAVRDCTSFGLPSMIRLGVRPANRSRAFLTAFAEVLKSGSAAAGRLTGDGNASRVDSTIRQPEHVPAEEPHAEPTPGGAGRG